MASGMGQGGMSSYYGPTAYGSLSAASMAAAAAAAAQQSAAAMSAGLGAPGQVSFSFIFRWKKVSLFLSPIYPKRIPTHDPSATSYCPSYSFIIVHETFIYFFIFFFFVESNPANIPRPCPTWRKQQRNVSSCSSKDWGVLWTNIKGKPALCRYIIYTIRCVGQKKTNFYRIKNSFISIENLPKIRSNFSYYFDEPIKYFVFLHS